MEGGTQASLTGYRYLGLSSSLGDTSRATFHLDGMRGWGIDLKIDFDQNNLGSIHRILIEYEDDPNVPGTAVVT